MSFELAEEIVLKQMIIGVIALIDNVLSQLKHPSQQTLISMQFLAQLFVEIYRGKFNQYRIPDYFRIDCSVTIEGSLKSNKKVGSSFTFAVYNVTGRRNAYSVFFRSNGDSYEGYKLSVFATAIPTITYNFRF